MRLNAYRLAWAVLAVALAFCACDDDRLSPIADTPPSLPSQTSCSDAASVTCGLGSCGGQAVPQCSDGLWVCLDVTFPAPEVCDRIDNDCDGSIDEGIFRSCYSGDDPSTLGVGACAPGVQRCGDLACYFEVLPSEEVCDGADNDCDGAVDEGVAAVPGCCSDAESEVCDGLDNNCNGVTDEGLLDPCGFCEGAAPDEAPCDGLDNDCDGRTDEDDPWPVEIGIAVDTSGSNSTGFPGQKAALQAVTRDIGALMVCALWDVLAFPTDPSGQGGLTLYAQNATAGDAEAAIARLALGPGFLEPSYDAAVALGPPHHTLAIRSIILVADEPGQSMGAVYEGDAAAILKALGVEVLTFSNEPDTYDMLGPALPLNSDIRAASVAFVRRRAGL